MILAYLFQAHLFIDLQLSKFKHSTWSVSQGNGIRCWLCSLRDISYQLAVESIKFEMEWKRRVNNPSLNSYYRDEVMREGEIPGIIIDWRRITSS